MGLSIFPQCKFIPGVPVQKKIKIGRHSRLIVVIASLCTGFGCSEALALDASTKLGSETLVGLLNFELAYGVRWRMQERDQGLISLGNGGERNNSNYDDGDLNYDQGKPVSNMFRAAGELTLLWGNFGAFARAYAFYDVENQANSRARTELSDAALEQVGRDIRLREAYLSARFVIDQMPLQFRLGKQVVNWGESRFFPTSGINVANPVDLPLFQQPTALPRDLSLPVGMLWGSLQINPFIAIEGYYQYEWQESVLHSPGTYLSTADPVGPGGYFYQAGPFSDQGTNVDAAFGLPAGTIGFDPYWLQIPRISDDSPSDQGQFGISVQMLAEKLNDTKFALSFANYHSKVPFLSLIAPGVENYLAYSKQAIAAQTKSLIAAGSAPENAAAAAQNIQFSQFLNNSSYLTEYPDNIRMLGLSVNTTSLRTGTAFFAEFSHHFNAPMPIFPNQVLDQILPGSTPEDPFPAVDLNQSSPQELANNYANTRANFIDYFDKTFFAFGATQLFGPQLGAAQSALTAEIGWLHIWNFPGKEERLFAAPGLSVTQTEPSSAFADGNSWAYRLAGVLTYNSVFGALTLQPRFGFSHNVSGNSPTGAGTFREGRKSLTVGLSGQYIQSLKADISYISFWGAEEYNMKNDRDYLNFSVRYYF
jgi:hypothetical protein